MCVSVAGVYVRPRSCLPCVCVVGVVGVCVCVYVLCVFGCVCVCPLLAAAHAAGHEQHLQGRVLPGSVGWQKGLCWALVGLRVARFHSPANYHFFHCLL